MGKSGVARGQEMIDSWPFPPTPLFVISFPINRRAKIGKSGVARGQGGQEMIDSWPFSQLTVIRTQSP